MDDLNQIVNWVDQAVVTWKAKGIKLQKGASLSKISEYEEQLEFKFPQEFIELYQRVDGFEDFEWDENMFSIWSLERILKEYKEDNDTNFIGFSDFLICSHMIGFSKTETGIYLKGYDQIRPITSSFQDTIALINANSDLIY